MGFTLVERSNDTFRKENVNPHKRLGQSSTYDCLWKQYVQLFVSALVRA